MKENLKEFLPQTEGLGLPIDPQIQEAVAIFRSQGINTIESCQGGEGHSRKHPCIRFSGNAYEGYKAFWVAKNFGYSVLDLALEWSEVDGFLKGPCWKITFKHTKRSGG